MKYKFDEIIDRSRTNSFKWKARELKNNGHEMYPMWVADMEFDASPAIQKRLADRVKEGVFGYELLSEDYYKAVQYWLKKRHGCEIPEGQIVYCANMMSGLSIILQEYTEEQDEVMMNVPTYGNFYHTIEGCGRAVNGSKLREVNGRFTFDLEDMERKVTNRTKAFLLCNPHNPTGTVWTEQELEGICRMKKQIMSRMNAMAYPFEHAFAEGVTIGAYMESEEWFEEVYRYIKENKEMTVQYIRENIPHLRVPESEATYLLWVDCSAMKMTDEEIIEFWKNECGIMPSGGLEFGEAGSQYVRLNLACPKKILLRVLENMKKGFDGLKS